MNRKFIKNSNLILHKILNSENAKKIIADFIESFINISISTLKINQVPENSKQYGIIDVRVITRDNKELNIGIQIIDGNYIQSKMLLYYAKVHSNQVVYGNDRKIVKTITINILDVSFFSSNEFHKVIKIKNNILNDSILETAEMHVLELPKFKEVDNGHLTKEEAWGIYLKGENSSLVDITKKQFKSIRDLDNMLEKYWEDEKS